MNKICLCFVFIYLVITSTSGFDRMAAVSVKDIREHAAKDPPGRLLLAMLDIHCGAEKGSIKASRIGEEKKKAKLLFRQIVSPAGSRLLVRELPNCKSDRYPIVRPTGTQLLVQQIPSCKSDRYPVVST
ncbi:hypothetical protein MAR_019830 [Mya arenaria]|uniref:Uncharacterized protein n=1 Tax=Mya arenaria TaxID=6604 RepID=A0ABY7E684_MYAAR|nr:hypothetical protein MAR_019830 [Mya arenaria]